MDKAERRNFLVNADLFRQASDELLEHVSGQLEECSFQTGACIMREGDDGDAAYLVARGTVRLEKEGIHLVTLGPGDCIGEFALIDEGPRSASVFAESDVLLLKWAREDFQKILWESWEVASCIFRMLIGKLRQDVSIQVEVGLKQERWRQDLRRASEIQMGMLPTADITLDGVTVSGYCKPATDVGGDYYDYLPLENGKLGLIIADVTGHGFYSGLFVAMAKSCLHTQAKIDYEPDQIMEAMNRTLAMSIQSGLFMTCCYVLLDAQSQLLTYTNAGHFYPYLYKNQTGSLEQLESTDPLLGMYGLEEVSFSKQQKTWEPGDVLLLYSDGITEAKNPGGEMFENDRLEKILAASIDKTPADIKKAVLQTLSDYCSGTEQDDDVTLVVAKAV